MRPEFQNQPYSAIILAIWPQAECTRPKRLRFGRAKPRPTMTPGRIGSYSSAALIHGWFWASLLKKPEQNITLTAF